MSSIYEVANLFSYNSGTGIVKRKSTDYECNTIRVRKNNIYYQTSASGSTYLVHRIAFLIYHGWLPDQIDHRNGIGIDNRICNLRDGSKGVNSQNRTTPRKSKTGIKGVFYRAERGGYQITISGKYIGCTRDFFNACCMRKSKELTSNYKDRE